jgi:hypothetical protein
MEHPMNHVVRSGTRSLLLAFTSLAVTLLAALPAHADCVDGVRKPTPAELDFLQRAHAALVAGLPEAVRPLERNNPQRPDAGNATPPSLCGGTPVGAFSPGVFTAFNFNFSPEEARARAEQRRVLRQQVDDLKKLPPDKEAEVRQLTEQARAAAASAPRRSRNDPPFTPEQRAQVERAEAEANRLSQAARKIQFDHDASVKPQTDALNERADRLQAGMQTFTVALNMNVQRFAEATPASEVITLGAPSANRSGSLRGRNVMVEVKGPAGPTRDAVVTLIDRAYLQSLLDAPLPDVAVSRQRVEANIARAASAPALAIASTVPLNASSASASTAPAAATVPVAAGVGAAAAATAASAPAAQAGSATAPATTTAQSPCPPPSRTASGATTASSDATRTGRDVGGEVGGAILGGGWGRSIGASVGGALGALGGSKPPQQAQQQPDCPR